MEYPNYWYEDQLARFMLTIPVLLSQVLAQAIYWSDFPLRRQWMSCLFLLILGSFVYGFAEIVYYLIWTYHLGFFQPMPFNAYMAAPVAFIVVSIAIYFR